MVLPVKNSYSELAVVPPNTEDQAVPRMVFSVRLWKKGRGSALVSRSKTSARSEKDSFMITMRFTGVSVPAAFGSASQSSSVSSRMEARVSWE